MREASLRMRLEAQALRTLEVEEVVAADTDQPCVLLSPGRGLQRKRAALQRGRLALVEQGGLASSLFNFYNRS